MHREINPPEEIVRRLFFVLYLVLVVIFLITVLLGMVQHRFDYLRLAMLAGVTALFLHLYGKRRLDFGRLGATFPDGGNAGSSDHDLCREAESLLLQASRVDGDWQQRQEVRRQLLSLLDRHPELWQQFQREIGAVFPALAEWAGKGDGSD